MKKEYKDELDLLKEILPENYIVGIEAMLHKSLDTAEIMALQAITEIFAQMRASDVDNNKLH